MLLLLLSSYAFLFQDPQPLKHVHVVVKVENVAVRQVLAELENQSHYHFFYSSQLFDATREVSLNFSGSLDEALALIFKNRLTYTVNNKQIVLKARDDIDGTPVFTPPAQRKVIVGVVRDDNNQSLPGVNVVLKGTAFGTTTDANGNYVLEVPLDNAIVTYSFIGYLTQEINAHDLLSIDVVLKDDQKTLDEVVVVGYGSVKKSDLTGSISTVSSKEIGDRQVSDLAYLIQGRATGVDVSGGTIRIRGVTTFNNTDPLIVIDGYIGGNLETLNPNDIDNIEILKDASSTAIYGARGANGVILITTKTGKPGPLVMNLKYYEGISAIPGRLDVMNAREYNDYVLELLTNSGLEPPPNLISEEARVDRTDWQDAVFTTGHNREVNLDFSGGTIQSSHFLSLGYKHIENPTFKGRQDDFIFLSNRNSFSVKKWIRAGTSLSTTFNGYHGGGEGGNPGTLENTLEAPPYIPIYDSTGAPYALNRNLDASEFGNPFTTALNNHLEGENINFQGTLWTELEPIPGFSYKLIVGATGSFGRDQKSNDEYTGGIAGPATLPASISKAYFYRLSPLIEQYVTFKRTLAKRHEISIMVGNTWQNGYRSGKVGVKGVNYDPDIPSVVSGSSSLVTEDLVGKYAYISYYSRGTYQFDNKYLLTVNFRADASPKFSPKNRWSTFPSVAMAWKIHEENFMKSSGIDQLKLRMGWGVSGNDAIGDFRYLEKAYSRNVYYPFGQNGIPIKGATVLNGATSNLKWESTTTQSVGVDVTIADGRLDFTADYYRKVTKDILYEVPKALSLGYGSNNSNGGITSNAAKLRNRGFELQLGYRSGWSNLHLSSTLLYSFNQNKVISLGDGRYLDGINRTDVGHPIGYFYGFIADGIFKTQSEVNIANDMAREKGFTNYQLDATQAGDVRFKDVNGDGHVDNDDRVKLGNSHPTNLFGLNTTITYKGFDFNFLLQGIAGSSIYDEGYDRFRGGIYAQNQSTYVLDRWRDEEHPGNGIVPRVIIGDPSQNNRPSSLKISDGRYLKLKQASLGYTLNGSTIKKIGFSKLRFYLSAFNVVTFTPYKFDFDPEIGGPNLSRGINTYAFPRARLIMVGFNVSF